MCAVVCVAGKASPRALHLKGLVAVALGCRIAIASFFHWLFGVLFDSGLLDLAGSLM